MAETLFAGVCGRNSTKLGYGRPNLSDSGESLENEIKGGVGLCKFISKCPIYFWNDPGDKKYKKAYFEKFTDVWCQGDYGEITSNGGIVIYGRSDAVLNPGGVRIGTAEIYRQVENLTQSLIQCVLVKNGMKIRASFFLLY